MIKTMQISKSFKAKQRFFIMNIDSQNPTLGDYCKWFEKNFSPEIMIPELPVIIRLDGNNFHNWAKNLDKPFDDRLMELMTDTTKFLVEETCANVGYTQSDEITLVLYSEDYQKSIYHEGKKQKILSKLTGVCVNYFNTRRQDLLPDHNYFANFDCRIFQVPNLGWAYKQLLWRERDATKNSISMLAQANFKHKELEGLNGSQLQDKLMIEKGVNWNDMPVHKKRGTYVKRTKVTSKFTTEDLAKLPPKHQAHSNPDLEFTRTLVQTIEFPILSKIADPITTIFY
jgi:tRNA(His) guanylyltransferase